MKLFVSDLDGTLLNRDFQISEVNMNAIRKLKEKGFELVVATGRIYHDAATICGNHGLSPYIIASNGACIFDEEGGQMYGRWLTSSDLKKIIACLEEMDLCYGLGNSEEYIAPTDWELVLDREAQRLRRQGQEITDSIINFAKYEMTSQNGFKVRDIKAGLEKDLLSCYSVSVVTHDNQVVQKIAEQMDRFERIAVTVSGAHNIEIMSREGTKGNALKYLAGVLKTGPGTIVAIGDSYNDLSMLQYAKTSIAMGNAPDDVKSICTFSTTVCEKNGFAAAVENILNDKNGRY